ncbi:MAG: aspartate aminotransferase family protein [Actinobacteria bacterium]|nr:aspartate aminotransferase family protein [Actinomycetota bacterium]
MSFDLAQTLKDNEGENFRLHSRFMNPQMARVLKTLGFDRYYTKGEGCYLYDRDGQRYLDLLAGFGVYALGRSHPVIKQALHDAIDADLPNLVQLDCALLSGLLAKALVERSHEGIERVIFANSGAESIEAAIKLSRYATGRKRILYCDHAFHGLTNGALSLNGGREFREGFGPLLPGCEEIRFGDLDALERELRNGDVAAFVVEPIQGKGVNLATGDYWHGVQELCNKHGALFVADEVQTGLGRTGRFFCHEHWDLKPDIITVSKALSGGFVPVGATLCSAKVHDKVFSSMERAVVHSSTFAQNHLAMVAGLATLQTLDEEGIVDHVKVKGQLLMDALSPLVERFELFHEVRGMGYMVGLVFGEPRSLGLRARWKMMEAARKGLFSQLIVVPLFHRHRILTQVAGDNMNVIKLLFPLVAGDEEIEYFVQSFTDVLEDAHKNSSLMVEFGKTLVKSAMRRDGD